MQIISDRHSGLDTTLKIKLTLSKRAVMQLKTLLKQYLYIVNIYVCMLLYC